MSQCWEKDSTVTKSQTKPNISFHPLTPGYPLRNTTVIWVQIRVKKRRLTRIGMVFIQKWVKTVHPRTQDNKTRQLEERRRGLGI